MGTTIRREPITTSIPAAPDYKFLNITNFGGIEKSSNPFVVNSNTASDCLNVYVDEDNALSTRPRLQTQANLLTITLNNTSAPITKNMTIIGVYDLHDGYLLHGVENNIGYMFKIVEKNDEPITITTITGADSVKNKCKIFEQNDVIYVLDGVLYKNIIGDKLTPVEGYVPTIRTGKTKTTDGSSYESLNLMSDKYKESYFWNSVNDTLHFPDAVEVSNEYFKPIHSNVYDYESSIIYSVYDDNTMLVRDYAGENEGFYYVELTETRALKVNRILGDDLSLSTIHGFTKDKRLMTGGPSAAKIYHIDSNNYTFVLDRTIDVSSYFTQEIFDFGISPTGKYVWVSYVYQTTSSGKIRHRMGLLDISGDTPSRIDFAEDTVVPFGVSFEWVKFSDDESSLIVSFSSDSGSDDDYVSYRMYKNWQTDGLSHYDSSYSTDKYANQGPAFYSDGEFNNIVLTHRDEDSWTVFYDQSFESPNTLFMPHNAVVNFHEGFVTFVTASYNNTKHIYVITDFKNNPTTYYNTYISDYATGYVGVTKFKDNDYIVLANGLVLVYDSPELPQVYVTTQITSNNIREEFETWRKIRDAFNRSMLCTRFDNNMWFASDNYTFRSEYNDPTYIPLSSYNDLGETYEPITGLSIVNDNILAVYKRNRIYIITPITVGNELTYSYTETKNVIGNDVVDAPILTILTEMPVIVSYNGIYALNQLENVQSSDRITALISETMNPKWLKERKEDVDRCITLNRLYWTYFILPHKKVSNGIEKDNDYTKIYLLDNRTGMWFYWELPIYVISAMIKDNKTHFITSSGELYSLETTDIINKFNKDLTEYYDDLKKPSLIPWHWTSQILSLNTINYSKRLVDTTFVLTDTDSSDSYALNYKFKAFRKNKNAETTELTLTNDIEYVESITKRTMIPRFNFLQFTLSNTEDDEKLNNNKLRLVGLGLKYVLLGGLY